MKAMSELFNLPLAVVPACRDPHWGTSIVEADDPVVWTIDRVNPRTTGGFSPKLLVSAQERAEAIVAAVNERDAMTARIEALEAEVDWRREEQDRADKRMAELRLSITHLENTVDLLGTGVSSLAAERDAMAAIIAELLRRLLVALPDDVRVADFRALPVVEAAEKYAPDWAEKETK